MRQNATKAMIEAQKTWIKLTKYRPYQKGEFIWLEGTNLHTTHPMRKLGSQRYGPFKILEVLGPVTFRIELPPQWKIHDVFHVKLLHPYKETEQYGENFQEPPPDLIDGKPKWEVEKILNIRTQGQRKQYLINWKGYSSAYNFWEPEQNIHAPALLKEFQRRHKGLQKVQKG